jgi:hypothetical protein
VTFLRWDDYAAWGLCAGRPALEESEGEVADQVPRLTAADRAALDTRKAALDGATAVEILPMQALPVGEITAEKGALGWGSLILAEYKDHSVLEVYPPDRILALAALVKYSILHNFANTNVGTPGELYAFGAQVTEAAQLSMNLRASVTALEHLVPGDYCRTCRAAYRCPALVKSVHAEVFGPLESPDDPEAKPVAVVGNDEGWRKILPKLALIKAWVAAVEAAAGQTSAKPVRRRKRRSRKGKRPQKARNHVDDAE